MASEAKYAFLGRLFEARAEKAKTDRERDSYMHLSREAFRLSGEAAAEQEYKARARARRAEEKAFLDD
jgi:hypothetical protein